MILEDVRLRAAAEMIAPANIMADIGADHAYLPVYLLKTGRIKKAFISDIHAGPLANARKTAAKYGVTAQCEFFCGDGLTPLSGRRIDAVAVCGMGGQLIQRLISQDIIAVQKIPQIILQPMSSAAELTEYVMSAGFALKEERILRDGHLFYRMMKITYTGSAAVYEDRFDYEYPPVLIAAGDSVMHEFLSFRAALYKKILAGIKQSSDGRGFDAAAAKSEAVEARLNKF